ncbi:MAG TPA: glycosyltransferase family 2 protein [Lutibacter sp.]
MLFKFLKYLQPTNYFSLLNYGGDSVFPKIETFPESFKIQLEPDDGYSSEIAKQYDLSWQAIQKGYIGTAETISKIEKIPLQDEYHFIRKYFSPFWVFYVFILRLVSFKNPFREIVAWYKTRIVKRSAYLKKPWVYKHWATFESLLLKEQPKVSIVIPTLNRYAYLKDVLADLEQQDYKNFEVIVIDQSEPFQEEFYTSFQLDLQVVQQQEKALWLARNRAIKLAEGDYLLLFDDDSRVETNWITQHLKCIDFFKAAISSGVSISKIGDKVPENYAFFRVSDQLDTGNVLIKKEVFKAIGLFDRQFEKQRMGDGEFGLRAYLHGFLNVSNPYAKRLHLKVETGGLRQMGSWDGFRPKKWFSPRPIPSVVYLFRTYFGNTLTRYALLKAVPPSLIPYKYKGNAKMMLLGYMLSVLLFPLVLYQVVKSWKLATKKLKEGAKIESLERIN